MEVKRRKGKGEWEASSHRKEEQRKSKSISLGRPRCKLCLLVTLVSVLLSLVLIAILPTPIDPVIIDLGGIKSKSFGGNAYLREAIRLFDGEIKGPEGFAIDGDGNMYTGLHDGRIVLFNDTHMTTVMRMGPPPYDNCGKLTSESHCGRVLGLEISQSDPYLLYICDCYHGIQTLHLKTGHKEVLVNTTATYPGVPPIKFSNDMVVLKNGSVFFTDSSYKFARNELLMEMYEGRPNGKLLHYNPTDGTVSVAIGELHFANGVCASKDESFLIISETSRSRILKYHLKGPKTGQTEIFMNELPGVPDNISPSSKPGGGFWIGFALLRNEALEVLGHFPAIRNVFVKLRLTRLIAESLPRNGLIMECDESGTVIRELYDMGGVKIPSVSEVLDLNGVLYLGSYDGTYIGKLDFSNK